MHQPTRLLTSVGGVTFALLMMILQLDFRAALLDSSTELLRQIDADVLVTAVGKRPFLSRDRMRAERARDAAEHRARGREDAERIRAAADRQQTQIVAQAYEEAQRLRGAGDARATSIYANAYGKDEEFFRFYRSLQAYRESFDSKEDVLILSPDSEFFQYMKQNRGR